MEQGNVFRREKFGHFGLELVVSIPLEQGNVFRLNLPLTLTADRLVSIPLEQGNVFRHTTLRNKVVDLGLNPFGTGQCLSTTMLMNF